MKNHDEFSSNCDAIRLQPAKVSVVIVNWNGARFLERCLSALMAQTVKPHEIILLDNASSDDSLKIARGFPDVRVIASDQNTGFARGNNMAIKAAAADSEWIALINPDAFADPGWLEEMLNAARRNPEFQVFGSKLVEAENPSMLDGAGDAYCISGRVRRIGKSKAEATHCRNECEVFSVCAAAALYRRDILNEVGGFDEDYFCYVEDVDLGFRFRLAGYRCLYVPASIVHHVGSGTTGGQHSHFAVYYGHRNLLWTFVKNMPGILFWILLPLHIALNLASIVLFVLRGQSRTILRAKWDALIGLPGVWQKRDEIQKRRVASVPQIWKLLSKCLVAP